MKVSNLITENKLEQAVSGLWHLPGADVEQAFAYSDGENEETYVKNVIASAADTSSTSAELESHIHDWPSEYHLTTKRAHLLRALDLSSLENVLELGCGCGAISRYLAEQGMNVDAIEGSVRRASIAHSRCRDLPNINIVNSNFNHLNLPENTYDAVFLIGVLEYAKRFCPDAVDDRSAVLEILAAVQASLKPEGVIVTAIENRLGLKYLMGATEDHYGVPYIGIHRYPDSAGICTYDHAEWRSILEQAGFNSNAFLAPFPDYKIPSVVLHEKFLHSTQAASHLRGSVSRDYLREMTSDFDEYLFWQACNQNGSLLDFANSYLIIMGRDNESADKLAVYDFSHFTGSQRKPVYRTATRKRRDESVVRKEKLVPAGAEDITQTWIQQVCADEDYLTGELLADIWLQNLMSWQDQQRLLTLYKDYFEFLKNYASENPAAKNMVDMLPFNIIVDEAGSYQSFDREWRLDESITPEFVLFRALFWFVYGNRRQFSLLFEVRRWGSIRDYIDSSFREMGIDMPDSLNDFADMEDRIQAAIGRADNKNMISSLLDTVPKAGSGEVMFYPRLYWAQPDEHCSEANSLKATAVMGADHQSIYFDIPGHLAADSLLRFDPAEREGYFHLHRMRLVDLAGEGKLLLELNDAQEISRSLTANGVSVCSDAESTVFIAHDNDPHFEIKLPAASENLRVEIEMDWPHSAEYEVVRDSLNQQFGMWIDEKAALQRQLDKLENIAELNKQLLADREQLRAIKGSRSYRLMRKLTGNNP
jgi:2-polyprenyl-3-methyl-5-hydroxy-6-metoxy-1,4-benzoquinol methylase